MDEEKEEEKVDEKKMEVEGEEEKKEEKVVEEDKVAKKPKKYHWIKKLTSWSIFFLFFCLFLNFEFGATPFYEVNLMRKSLIETSVNTTSFERFGLVFILILILIG